MRASQECRVYRNGTLLIVVLTSLTVYACGEDDVDIESSDAAGLSTSAATVTSAPSASPDPVGPVITALEADAISDGIVEGRLVEESDCLFLVDSEGRRRPLVLPYGTSWDDATAVVVDADGTTASVGQMVTAQGGGESLDSLVPYFLNDQFSAVQRCAEIAETNIAYVVGTLSPEE